jgi:cell division protein FtsW
MSCVRQLTVAEDSLDLWRRFFLACCGILLGLGLMMVYSSSITSRPTTFEWIYFQRQVAALGVGLLGAAFAATRPPDFWQKTAPLWFLLTLILLIAVLLPGVGTRVKGAQRWIRLLGVSVQPSEIAKITLPLWTCALIAARPERLRGGWLTIIPVALPTLIVTPLVLIEPDLGTAVFLGLGTILTLWLAGWSWRNFAVGGLLLVPMGLGVFLLKPYQRQRLTGFLEAWADLDAAPYQIRQSLVTLGSGGWWGEGLGRGFQKLSFLPEANTDFVFAVIGEELGLVGTLALVSVWCGLYLCGMRLLTELDQRSFAFQAGATMLTMLVFQALLNVAVVTAMVPPKGIAHPLISVGGSNLVVSVTMLGVIASLSRRSETAG